MELLEYCIELKSKKYDSERIVHELELKGLSNEEALKIEREADNIYLDLLINKKKSNPLNFKKLFRILSLLFLLLLFLLAFLGYIGYGIMIIAVAPILVSFGILGKKEIETKGRIGRKERPFDY